MMKRKVINVTLGLVVSLACGLAGCGGGGGDSGGLTGGGSTGSVDTSTAMTSEQAKSSYFPTVIGTKWTYNYNVYEAVSANTVKMTAYDGTSVTNTYVWSNGALLLSKATYSSGIVSDFSPATLQMPSNMNIGSAEKSSSVATLKSPTGETATATLDVTVTINAAEKITVPAGTFDTIKITKETKKTYNGSTTTATSTEWYAKGVGMVKASNSGTTISLESYNIPNSSTSTATTTPTIPTTTKSTYSCIDNTYASDCAAYPNAKWSSTCSKLETTYGVISGNWKYYNDLKHYSSGDINNYYTFESHACVF